MAQIRFIHIKQHMLSVQPAPGTSAGVQVAEKTDVDDAVDQPWKLILYDDNIHTFDEVINQLMKAIGCSLTKARELTFKVHNEGKALVFEGTFEECLQINAVLQEIQLITEIKG